MMSPIARVEEVRKEGDVDRGEQSRSDDSLRKSRVPTPLFPATVTAVHGNENAQNDDEHIPRRFHLQPTLQGTFTPPKLNPKSRRARNDQRAVEECRVFHRRVLQGLQWFVFVEVS
jgi:hypothetical protein